MNLACISEVHVQNEHALLFSAVSKPAPVLDYIKAISSLVGASHILAVFEENDSIKVYFDDKRFVDVLIKSGIHIMGQHVKCDYVVPPGTKVVISHIDPVITNFDLMKLLSLYGSIVSPVFHLPFSDDAELCHIDFGVRYVYMILNKSIPNTFEFKYDDKLYTFKIEIDDNSALVPYLKSDSFALNNAEFHTNAVSHNSVAGPSCAEGSTTEPILVSVESAVSETNFDEQDNVSKPSVVKQGNLVKHRRGRLRKNLRIKRLKVTAASSAAKRIKNNVKHKWMGKKNIKKPVRRKATQKKIPVSRLTLHPLSSSSSSDRDNCSTPPLRNDDFIRKKFNVFNKEDLEKYVNEVKHQKMPLEFTRNYLGSKCNNSMLQQLIEQLNEYKRSNNCPSLKSRISRLINALEEGI